MHIPQTLADIVESVLGLDTRRVVRTRAATTGTATTPAGNAVVPGNSGPAGASPLTPPKVASLYGFPTSSAAGQTIGILEFGGGYAKSDITAFLSPVGIATPSIVDQSVDGGSNTPAGSVANVTANDPDLEVTLDIDVVASVAVGAEHRRLFRAEHRAGIRRRGFQGGARHHECTDNNHVQLVRLRRWLEWLRAQLDGHRAQ